MTITKEVLEYLLPILISGTVGNAGYDSLKKILGTSFNKIRSLAVEENPQAVEAELITLAESDTSLLPQLNEHVRSIKNITQTAIKQSGANSIVVTETKGDVYIGTPSKTKKTNNKSRAW